MSLQSGKIKKKNKKKSKKNKISFDQEIVTKDDAQQIVKNISNEVTVIDQDQNEKAKERSASFLTKKKEKKKKKKVSQPESLEKQITLQNNTNENLELEQLKDIITEKEGVSKKMDYSEEEEEEETLTNKALEQINNGELVKNKESKRALKRKKHAQLLLEKQLKSELAQQQKALNYLSLWKHNKQAWKFEKLRQVWLQQNMYDSDKIPDEFFEVLVEYFSDARGKVKQIIIEEAIKIIESTGNDDSSEVKNDVTEKRVDEVKLTRARNVVQTLDE